MWRRFDWESASGGSDEAVDDPRSGTGRDSNALQVRDHDDHWLQTYGMGKRDAVVSYVFRSPHE